ncbi:conserved hypothetical protein [Verrucomicrobia bacterium]|nr:conserved hypothetical protein [Verrucomicrobiota bacterium]
MSRRRKPPGANQPQTAPMAAAPVAVQPVSSWRRWAFRALAALGAPLALLALLELGLRLAGYGYPTHFLLPSEQHGRRTWVQNPKFGWRFFGRQLARVPAPCSILQPKPANTIRVFVVGESAAFGDPQPEFGLPRMLEALLDLRYPGTQFEVINAAMTAINSHVILPIARDCSSAEGDLWVIYMGNNEVVGPFGAGTVFGPQAPAEPWIRASLALKSLRFGQMLDNLRQTVQRTPPDRGEWGGMTMFLGHEVPLQDPRMKAVHAHFQANLDDIIEAGRRAGVGVVVSTVAVNLRDCAPFGSTNRPDLSTSDLARWRQLCQKGIEARQAGRNQEATDLFHQAAQIDDTSAELNFRQGDCALALGRTAEAQQDFGAARDLDTLRFRCDSRLNELIRQAASHHEQPRILLADAERAFAEQSTGGVPGDGLFYEHVHLTFEGNYLLARTTAAQLEKLLPRDPNISADSARPWPSLADCARRLAWCDWTCQTAWAEILARLSRPPFTAQLNHTQQMQSLKALTAKLAALQPEAASQARALSEAALATAPDDPWLHAQLAALQESAGDLAGADASARRAVDLLPTSRDNWFQLGVILGRRQQFEPAADAFRRALELDPQEVASWENLGRALEKLGRRQEAIRQYRSALALKPNFGPVWLDLGQALETEGRAAEAQDCFQKALANPLPRAAELSTLARFCQGRGWLEAAATNYAAAVELSPGDAQLNLETGLNLAALGRHPEAAARYAEAVRLAPDSGLARFRYGLELGRQGKSVVAEEQFREAVRLLPDLLEARLNLGRALMNEGRNDEALEQFQEVLRLSPTNELAARAAQALRAKLAP